MRRRKRANREGGRSEEADKERTRQIGNGGRSMMEGGHGKERVCVVSTKKRKENRQGDAGGTIISRRV